MGKGKGKRERSGGKNGNIKKKIERNRDVPDVKGQKVKLKKEIGKERSEKK